MSKRTRFITAFVAHVIVHVQSPSLFLKKTGGPGNWGKSI